MPFPQIKWMHQLTCSAPTPPCWVRAQAIRLRPCSAPSPMPGGAAAASFAACIWSLGRWVPRMEGGSCWVTRKRGGRGSRRPSPLMFEDASCCRLAPKKELPRGIFLDLLSRWVEPNRSAQPMGRTYRPIGSPVSEPGRNGGSLLVKFGRKEMLRYSGKSASRSTSFFRRSRLC